VNEMAIFKTSDFEHFQLTFVAYLYRKINSPVRISVLLLFNMPKIHNIAMIELNLRSGRVPIQKY
jgi:hypothetical protein